MRKFLKNILAVLCVSLLLVPSTYAGSLSDISRHQNQTAIEYLNSTGVIQGYPDGTFQPERTVNRAELLKILIEGKGVTPQVSEYSNCFPDVIDDWFAPYVCYAKELGWVEGYPDGNFKPAREVNKVEAIKMLVNSQSYEVVEDISENVYSDVTPSDWFAPYVKVAREKGLLEETGNTFSPSDYMKRASISENVYRAVIVRENQLDSFDEFTDNLYLVTKVVDGDTIDVMMDGKEQRIRFIGVDTPETVHPSKPVECFGREASDITKDKLLNVSVQLEADSTQGDTDSYGRLLRYVVLQDGTNFNKWLIENGYGFEYTYNVPYKYQDEFKSAESSAENRGKGLWAEGACSNDDSDTSSNTGYKFYVSSQARSKYYCETDPAWENLSKSNLLEYDSEDELKADFPNLVLNQEC